jgi:hypothetical protein
MKRPITIENNRLLLRYGIMREAEIPLSNIKKITLTSKELDKEEDITRFSLLGELEDHNVIIEIHNEQKLRGLFGKKKAFTKIALFVDTPAKFRNFIEASLQD